MKTQEIQRNETSIGVSMIYPMKQENHKFSKPTERIVHNIKRKFKENPHILSTSKKILVIGFIILVLLLVERLIFNILLFALRLNFLVVIVNAFLFR